MSTYNRVTRVSTIDLVGRLVNNLSSLFDREVELAKVEAKQTAVDTVRSVSTLLIGGVLGLLAVVCLVVAGILALALLMPGWLAGLIGFAVFAIAALIALLIGKGELQTVTKRPLGRTRETIREDLEWARHHLKSSER